MRSPAAALCLTLLALSACAPSGPRKNDHGVVRTSMMRRNSTDYACQSDWNGKVSCSGKNAEAMTLLGKRALIAQPAFDGKGTAARQYRRIVGGKEHFCAISLDHHLYCWGSNNHGQLFAVPAIYAAEPTLALKDTVTDAAAAPFGTCATLSAGRGVCGGDAKDVGVALTEGRKAEPAGPSLTGSPAVVVTKEGAQVRLAQFALSDRFGCGLTSDGTLWCWTFPSSAQEKGEAPPK